MKFSKYVCMILGMGKFYGGNLKWRCGKCCTTSEDRKHIALVNCKGVEYLVEQQMKTQWLKRLLAAADECRIQGKCVGAWDERLSSSECQIAEFCLVYVATSDWDKNLQTRSGQSGGQTFVLTTETLSRPGNLLPVSDAISGGSNLPFLYFAVFDVIRRETPVYSVHSKT